MELNKNSGALLVSLIVAGVVSRILPHPANMALVTGATIFAATKFDRLSSMIVPLSIMAVSDVLLGFHPTMFFTWGSFALIALFASCVLQKKCTLTSIAGVTLVSSLVFFIISNFGVWLVGNMYPHTTLGLTTCFVNALPFLRNTLVGDAFYTASIFGIYEVAQRLFSRKLLATS